MICAFVDRGRFFDGEAEHMRYFYNFLLSSFDVEVVRTAIKSFHEKTIDAAFKAASDKLFFFE